MFKRTIEDLGTEWDLAKEFEKRKKEHKYSVLVGTLTSYYETIMQDEILLPFDTPEVRAENIVQKVYNRDKKEYDRLYEIAWTRIANMMD